MEDRKKLRIFFLEDNPDDVELELYELEKAGYHIEHAWARNRREFLDRVKLFSPDIVLADYSLPDITGTEAIELCVKQQVDAPVILITGEGNEQMAVDSLRLGAVDYIIKRNISGLPARISRALEIWSDRKAKKQAEARGKELQALLFETQKMEAIGKLAGGIAHDFNNILLGVIGYADLCLADLPANPEVRSKLETIISFSLRGADLVKQLLIFSKKVPMKFEVTGLNTFIADTVRFLKRIVEETIEIKLDLMPGSSNISCDASQFTQLLMNLVLNARDAMQGKGVITIKTSQCALSSVPVQVFADGHPAKSYVCLSVVDNGIGIDAADLERIFDPFFTTKDVGKGTGLGLSIVYSVVTAHRGAIKVSSEKGKGTTFNIYLPMLESSSLETAAYQLRVGEDAAEAEEGSRETILIAEDEDALRELAAIILGRQGYTVLLARDGEEASQIIGSGRHKIDLILSDMMMPHKSGIDLFRSVRSTHPSVKFVLVTGYSLDQEDDTLLKNMSAVMTKPYTEKTLRTVIREVLSR